MEDLIRWSDAIKATWQEPTYTDPLNVLTEVRDRIEAIPSADRPRGEWIVSCKDSICPICGKDEAEFICGTEDWYGYGLSNYCPNCGARMLAKDTNVPNKKGADE